MRAFAVLISTLFVACGGGAESPATSCTVPAGTYAVESFQTSVECRSLSGELVPRGVVLPPDPDAIVSPGTSCDDSSTSSTGVLDDGCTFTAITNLRRTDVDIEGVRKLDVTCPAWTCTALVELWFTKRGAP